MHIPTFDLRASSVLAGQAHEGKIFPLCSLDRHHTALGQLKEPDLHLQNAEHQSFTWLSGTAAHTNLASGMMMMMMTMFGMRLFSCYALSACLTPEDLLIVMLFANEVYKLVFRNLRLVFAV